MSGYKRGSGSGFSSGLVGSSTPLLPIGDYINKDFTTLVNLNDFTVTAPTSTIGLSGGYLNMQGGNNSLNNFIQVDSQDGRNCLTMLYKWKHTTRFIPRDNGAGIYFLSGLRGVYGNNNTLYAVFDMTTGGNDGTIAIYSYNSVGGAQLFSQGSAISYSTDHEIEVILERDDYTVSVTVNNLTVPDTASTSVDFTFNFGDLILNSLKESKFCVFNYAGEQDIISSVVTSNQLKNVPYLYLGDSIIDGRYAGDESNRFWKRLSTHQTTEPYAGSGARLEWTDGCVDDFTLLSPQNVIIQLGGNDISGGVASGTWQAAMSTIRTAFVNAGTNVIWAHTTPRTGLDITAINDYIDANFSGDTIITTTYDDLVGTGTNLAEGIASDNVHPEGLGNWLIYRAVGTALGFTMESLTELTSWSDLGNTTATGSTLEKTAGGNSWDGSGMSVASFDYTSIKVYAGFVTDTGQTFFGAGIGFSESDTGDSYTDIEQGVVQNRFLETRPQLDGVLQADVYSPLPENALYEVELSDDRTIVRVNNVEYYNEENTQAANVRIKAAIYRENDKVIRVHHT